MSNQTETTTFVLDVDATKADAKVAETRAHMEKEVGGVGSALDRLGTQAKALQQKMAPAAAAISGVSAALGDSAGAAGKAIAAVGQMVAAFGAGGPFAVAIVAATLAVNKLQQSWDDTIAAQDRALNAQYAGLAKSVALAGASRAALDSARERLASSTGATTKDSFTGLNEDFKPLIAAAEARVALLRKNIGIDGTSVDELNAQISDLGMSAADVLEQNRRNRESQIKIGDREVAQLKEALQLNKDALRVERQVARAAADKPVAKKALTAKELARPMSISEDSAMWAAVEDARLQREGEKMVVMWEMHDDEIERTKMIHNQKIESAARWYTIELEMAEDAEKKKKELESKASDERKKQTENDAEAYGQMSADALTKGAQSAASLVLALQEAKTKAAEEAKEGIVSGLDYEKIAYAKFLSEAAASAGGFVQLEGAKILATGISGALGSAGLNPLSIAQIAGGTALIGAGVAIQQGGPSAVNALLGISGSASGGASGGASKKATSSSGVNRGSGSGGAAAGGGGGLVVNLTYGVTGPNPDETARVINRALRAGKDNGGFQ